MTEYDIIIIGAGPASLQLAYYLTTEITQFKYLIVEKSHEIASFFNKFPHSEKLISVNKIHFSSDKNYDPDFYWRHDWNSLLNDDNIVMKNFSSSYFPSRQELQQYLSHFAKYYNINIMYNTNIVNITKKGAKFTLTTDTNDNLYCKKVIISTGLSKPNIPENIKNIEKYSVHYKDFDFQNHNLHGKRVLILGCGNSAFEVANLLTPFTSNIVILGKSKATFSIYSHYVGNVRSQYMDFLDTFILKSMNGLDHYIDKSFTIEKKDDKYELLVNHKSSYHMNFDLIINCTGWKFDHSILKNFINIPNRKYPYMNSLYEYMHRNDIYFIGSLMHTFDHKLSSGGFIHGFRYLINNFIKIHFSDFIPKTFESDDALCEHIYSRINNASSIYQMHGQIADIFWKDSNKFIYHEAITLSWFFTNLNIKVIPDAFPFAILTLEYGRDKEPSLTKLGGKKSSIGTESSSDFLHPVVRIYDDKYNKSIKEVFYPSYRSLHNNPGLLDELHMDENLLADFSGVYYIQKIKNIISSYNIHTHFYETK